MKNIAIKKNIETVRELKELLRKFEDDLLVNFGTRKYGFEINSYNTDSMSLALMSDDLEKFKLIYGE